jgi:DNA-binding winged helix-turn-helix (wHTH) protein
MADTGRLQWHPDGNPDKTRTQGIDKRTGMNDMNYSADNTTDDSVMTMRKTPFLLERWRVEPDTRQLQHLDSGEIRSLEPRLMRLLTLLAATPGQVLRREALIEELWPRVIVNENSLTRAVSELRRKLETDSTCATLIDTIPKTGYRLSAGCRVRNCPEAVADTLAAQHETRARSYSRPLLGGAMSLALTAAPARPVPLPTRARRGARAGELLLADVLEREARAPQGRIAVVVRLSRLPPPGPRPYHRRVARALLEDCAQRHGGQVLQLCTGQLEALPGQVSHPLPRCHYAPLHSRTVPLHLCIVGVSWHSALLQQLATTL